MTECLCWIADHPFGVLFLFIFCGLAVYDLYLKYKKNTSISEDTWLACSTHPTLIMAGTLATIGVGWLVRDLWGLVLLAGLLGGHLFSGIAPTSSNQKG